MRRFVDILLINLCVVAAVCIACVGLFVVASMVRELTGWSTIASAGSVVAFTIVAWSAVRAWLETK